MCILIVCIYCPNAVKHFVAWKFCKQLRKREDLENLERRSLPLLVLDLSREFCQGFLPLNIMRTRVDFGYSWNEKWLWKFLLYSYRVQKLHVKMRWNPRQISNNRAQMHIWTLLVYIAYRALGPAENNLTTFSLQKSWDYNMICKVSLSELKRKKIFFVDGIDNVTNCTVHGATEPFNADREQQKRACENLQPEI